MKKLFAVLLIIIAIYSFVACKPQPATEEETPSVAIDEEVVIRSASLKGPTTMGMIQLLNRQEPLSYTLENTMYGQPDVITGLLVKGELDVAAIPANLAAVLYNKTGGNLQVAAINTMGVLYIVENGESIQTVSDLAGKTIYATGKGTTPEIVLNQILLLNGLDPATDVQIEYKSESTAIAALLTSDSVPAVAMLPQPYIATVMAKNPSLRMALDLTAEWAKGDNGQLVTGVVVVRREFAQNHPEAFAAFLADYHDSVDWVNANPALAADYIAAAEIVPSAEVALVALPYCNPVFIQGAVMKPLLSGYLNVLFEANPELIGGALPQDDFYYNA